MVGLRHNVDRWNACLWAIQLDGLKRRGLHAIDRATWFFVGVREARQTGRRA
ncbi:hypothetical protein MexAM1_META1p5033 [Methylorubrum extorquens AM1]|jgi:hypothetical protein|uniref:Uncharacterized protein n=1 Tax=Methylorubrum extorquens (strain ATCC 14718 / DSM 1338 / JCM 2805 / NCIMB 9133 / AM1) TaxID=272630 RepID=C5ATT8_METEA|nr:hypothetical protein MexAM1_META1p5033 [Methylorubrum extorquens AM1]